MVTITCPWCDEDQPLTLADVVAVEASFTCPDCGTSVLVSADPEPALELAA